jgi:hypothetical protein
MITCKNIGSYGRLGNQFFQYAALKSLALKNNYELGIPFNGTHHNQQCLLKYFNLDCMEINNNYISKFLYKEEKEKYFNSKFYDLPDGVDINGFFQHYDYFNNYLDNFANEFSLKKDIELKCNEKFNEIKNNNKDYEIVSVHIRLGDVGRELLIPNFNDSEFGKYFLKSKKLFEDKKVKFLIFTGGCHSNTNINEINFLKDILPGDDYFFSNDFYLENIPSEISDFYYLTKCDHNILCHETSFGWWAGLLSSLEKTDKIITIPKNYYFYSNFDPSGAHHKNFIIV